MNTADIVILGAVGFGGGELLRLLANHPHVRSLRAVSRRYAGQPVTAAHPHLRGQLALHFESDIDWATWSSEQPVVFSAMPSLALAAQYALLAQQWQACELAERLLLIDLSGDFRLDTPAEFARHYGKPHPCPHALGTFAYGLAEWQPERLAGALRIANPGCFATAIELALLPLAGIPTLGRVCVSAMTGSSGSGATPGVGTHHPTRAHDLRAYKTFAHQHLGETNMLLARHGMQADIAFVPHSAPLVRGIFATVQLDLEELGVSAEEFMARYTNFCAQHTFVDLVTDSPRVAAVAGTNRCELTIHISGRHAVVLCALDNLGKGMAGQAVQNMNLARGWPMDAGLRLTAAYP